MAAQKSYYDDEDSGVPYPRLIKELHQLSHVHSPLVVCVPSNHPTAKATEALKEYADSLNVKLTRMDTTSERNTLKLESAIQVSVRDGAWLYIDNFGDAPPSILRAAAVGVFNYLAAQIHPNFRLWMSHRGDIDLQDSKRYPATLIVPAYLSTSHGEVLNQSAQQEKEIKDSSHTSFSTAGADALELVEKLYSSDKSVTQVTVDDTLIDLLPEIADALKVNRAARSLTLDRQTVGPGQVGHLCGLLTACTKLTRLSLVQCGILDPVAIQLADALQQNAVLEELDLSSNPSISDQGLIALASLLLTTEGLRRRAARIKAEKATRWRSMAEEEADAAEDEEPPKASSARIKVFRFSKNNTLDPERGARSVGFHYSSVKALADMLADNPYLRTVEMAQSRLTTRGVRAIGKALQTNKVLEELDVSDNLFGDAAGFALADALYRKNRSLRVLKLNNCSCTVVSLVSMAIAARNCPLRHLDIGGNKIVQLPEPQQLCNAVFADQADQDEDPQKEILDTDSLSDDEDTANMEWVMGKGGFLHMDEDGGGAGPPNEPAGAQAGDLSDLPEHLSHLGEISKDPIPEAKATGQAGPPQAGSVSMDSDMMLPEDPAERAAFLISQRYHRQEGIGSLTDTLVREGCGLDRLHLDFCGLDTVSTRRLCSEVLRANTSLTALSLSGNFSLDESASFAIKDLVSGSKHLKELDVSRTTRAVGERALLALEAGESLEEVDVSDCGLAEEALQILFDDFNRNSKIALRRFVFGKNEMSKYAFINLSAILREVPHHLTVVELPHTCDLKSWHDQGSTAFDRLGAALRQNRTLERLVLTGNGMTDVALAAFVEAFVPLEGEGAEAGNSTLTSTGLRLSQKRVTEERTQTSDPTLRFLELSENHLTAPELEMFYLRTSGCGAAPHLQVMAERQKPAPFPADSPGAPEPP